MKYYHLSLWLIILTLFSASFSKIQKTDITSTYQSIEADVCVYGATASGIIAAIAIKKEGKSVVIIEPGRWAGGMLGAGIKPRQDCPNIQAVGGLSRSLLETLGVREGRIENKLISPKDIREDFLSLIQEHDIQVIYNHRVSNCRKDGSRIAEAMFDLAPFSEDGLPPQRAERQYNLQVIAKIFIDAGYNGDLMACSGVSFRVGRESTLDYGEENAGVRPPTNLTPIDPFSEPGNPNSPVLKWIDMDHAKQEGSRDQYTQAYNFRFYLTSEPGYRVLITPPDNYEAVDYELVGRYVEYLVKNAKDSSSLMEQLSWIFPGWMNAGEYNYQRRSLITMAPVGISHRYANGDYGTKARIWKEHKDYLRGLHHFLSTDARVPVEFRSYTKSFGLDKRPHPDTNGWPHQLYIRVSRRLHGDYTITADDVYNRTSLVDPIGLAQYGIDTYPARRIWLEKNDTIYVALEGKMFIGGAKGPTNVPYPIPYRTLTPKESECSNLLVPVCFSATHLGYASARMEPVFMICGESAGVAAVQAIDENVSVQNIDQAQYQKKLRSLGQILEYSSVKPAKQEDFLLTRGHAHNDYLHQRPLLDALANGFTSVEVDVFLVDGELLIGHDHAQLQPGKTLKALYLEPLAKRVQANGGSVQKEAGTFYLLIDFKTDEEETYTLLKKQLMPYHPMLTEFNNTATKINAVTIIITGNRPVSTMAKESQRWAGYDGRVSDLGHKPNQHLMPWISDYWWSHFSWKGSGKMPAAEQSKLDSLAHHAHANGQMIRFWASPDTPASWAAQQKAGVDLINSDRLPDLAEFLNTQDVK